MRHLASVDVSSRSSQEALLANVLRLVDGALRERALVFGSLPPAGRDLDLVVHPPAAADVTEALARAGFTCRLGVWALFCDCSVAAVELLPPARLQLPDVGVAAVFAEARPLPGLARLVEPAPHHALLILAVRLARASRLEPRHRERIALALRNDPEAWVRAHGCARESGAADALARLRRFADGGGTDRAHSRPKLPRPTRVLAVCAPELERAAFHSRALADGLDRLGYECVVVQPGAAGVRAWWSLSRQLGRSGVVVVAAALESAMRPPRLVPPPRRCYAIRGASLASGSRRVLTLDATLTSGEVCELIAADAWQVLVRRGLLATLFRFLVARRRRER